MPTTAQTTYTGLLLQPVYSPEQVPAPTNAIGLAPSTTYPAGQLLAEITATPGVYGKYDGTILADPIGAPTVAQGSAGTLAAGLYYLAYSYVNANGETLIGPTGSVTIGASKQIDVTGLGALPTGAASVNWYLSLAAGSTDLGFLVNNAGGAFSINALPAAGAKLPPRTSTAYKLTSGAGRPACILGLPCVTDASGNITYNTTGGGGQFGEQWLTAPAYFGGAFNVGDLTGLDAHAVTVLAGRFLNGGLSGGIFFF
jgi:hypothetical protein